MSYLKVNLFLEFPCFSFLETDEFENSIIQNYQSLMGKKVFLTGESAKEFSNALDLLNESINEFNKVADKMIPEKLITEGIASYLPQFCQSVEASSNVKILFSSNKEKLKTSEDVDIELFRSVKTLLLMLVNSSRPTELWISINESKTIKITLGDNGKRNVVNDSQSKVTLENVQSILNGINGKLFIDTLLVQGNRVEIEV